MNLTAAALIRTRFFGVVFVGLAVMGLIQYGQLPREDMPPFTIRFASIVTQFPGASPERVESLVTDPLEEVAQEIAEVKSITSESRTGLSVISVELRQDIAAEKLQAIWDRLRRKIDTAAASLPDGIQGPDLKDDSIGIVYGIVVGVQNDGFTYDELEHYAEYLRDKILALEDASEVEIGGAHTPQVYIDYDPQRLSEAGLTASSLQSTLAATNIVYPGGSVVLGDERVILEPSGNFNTLSDLEETLVPLPGGGTIALGDLTTVTRGHKTPASSLVRINGKPGMTLSIAVREGANLVRLGRQVDALVEDEYVDLPVGMSLFRVAYQDKEVEKSVSDFIGNLLQSVAVVFLVMLVMLGLRTGLVVASLIPMTMLVTLFVMGQVGEGLNQVTLAGLIMALGMLVDNAIVMSEAIVVEMERGKQPRDAAIQASSELAAPLLISSLTTSAAFLAFYLAESLMGEIVGPLFVVITIALLSSWFLSLTLIPYLLVALVQPAKKTGEGRVMALIRRAYRPTLAICLRFRWSVIIATVVLFVAALSSFSLLPFVFFPDSERPLVQVDVNLPLGTRIESTDKAVAKLESFIRTDLSDDVVDVTSFIGQGPVSYDLGYQPGEANSGYAHLLINTRSGDANGTVIKAINEFALVAIPTAEVRATRLAGGGGGVPIEVRVFGDSPAKLYQIGERIKQKLLATAGTRNVSDNWGPQIKKFVVEMRQNQLRRAGMTNQDVAVSLQTVLTGFTTGEFREEEESVPITMRADDATEYRVGDVRNTTVHPMRGGPGLPLSQVADVLLGWQYPRIRRRNLTRMYSVTSYLNDGATAPEVTVPLVEFLEQERQSWPRGYTYELGGESEQSDEGMGSVAEKLPLGFGIILLVLVFQFNSVRRTVIVLATVPIGLVGVILGLHLFRSYFGFFGFLGIIALAGIIINNAIVLLDRIRIEIEDNGLTEHDAIGVACNHRMRPILLTTLTTTLGLIPLYLGGGAMWEPMAVAIMVGLLFGTLITLVFVPVLYSLLFRTVPKAGSAAS
ncbi:MAG: efflux RND transporter permease subunit [Proteobacteria bacterium]|nr:efflux RND transporter permease subunit [Pseudomonadota bacterium]